MKTTYSVMRELVKEIMQAGFDVAMGGRYDRSEEWNKKWGEKEYDNVVKKYGGILSHSLAEARREWVEEMVKLVTDKKGRCRNGGFCSVKCGHAGWWTNNVLDEILKSPDLLTGDNPEEAK